LAVVFLAVAFFCVGAGAGFWPFVDGAGSVAGDSPATPLRALRD
jgi:hypothetical protein